MEAEAIVFGIPIRKTGNLWTRRSVVRLLQKVKRCDLDEGVMDLYDASGHVLLIRDIC